MFYSAENSLILMDPPLIHSLSVEEVTLGFSKDLYAYQSHVEPTSSCGYSLSAGITDMTGLFLICSRKLAHTTKSFSQVTTGVPLFGAHLTIDLISLAFKGMTLC